MLALPSACLSVAFAFFLRRGRSASTTFAQRRSIFSFVSTLASKELPSLLAVLLHPLVDVTVQIGRPRSDLASASSPVTETERDVKSGTQSRVYEYSPFTGACGRLDDHGVGVVCGFEKEACLRDFIAVQLEEAAASVARDCLMRSASESSSSAVVGTGNSSPEENTGPKCDGTSGSCGSDEKPASEPESVEVANGGAPYDALKNDAAAVVIGRYFVASDSLHSTEKAIIVSLAGSCLLPKFSVRLHGCLKTLYQLQLQLRRVLLPAAPFLLLLYRTVLLRLVPAAPPAILSQQAAGHSLDSSLAETEASVLSTGGYAAGSPGRRASTSENSEGDCTEGRGRANSLLCSARGGDTENAPPCRSESPHPAKSRGRHQKQTLHLTILLIRSLLETFPDFAAAWERLLQPAGPRLQRLLDAAVATAAAAPVCPRKDGSSKKSIPAIIALVCSWASQPVSRDKADSLCHFVLTTSFPRHFGRERRLYCRGAGS